MIDIISATVKKNRREIRRAMPITLLWGRIVGGIAAVIFPYFMYKYFLNGNLSGDFTKYTNSSDYLTYIVLGAAINLLAVSTLMNVGRALITELRAGTLESVLISPAPRLAYFVGTLIEQVGRSLFEFIVVVILGLFLGANLWRILSLQAILVIIIAIVSFFSMSVVLSSIMLYTRDTYISQNTLFLIMTIVCGVSFPVEYLPKFVQYIASIFPMTYTLKLIREVVMSDGSILANMDLVIYILILSFIYLVLGCYFNKRIEKKMVENIFG